MEKKKLKKNDKFSKIKEISQSDLSPYKYLNGLY